MDMDMMTPRQTLFTLALAVLLLVFVVELVRRHRLREEFSWLWVVASAFTVLLVAYPPLLRAIIAASGASKATTTIFMLSIAFLALVCVHMCTKLTENKTKTKRLAQKMAILGRRDPAVSENIASRLTVADEVAR
ncbi:MAG: DUF2304 domain-containing protein [candidate division WS1 bacterium]|jgi:hypothetical protein|nr:DUF2304 domain-containing protein [candidate division WS1 bacterium]